MARDRDRTILDGWFHPRDAEEVRLACGALVGGSTQGSWGEVRSPGLLSMMRGRARADRDGLWSEQIFGPLVDDRCLCGKYQGAAARGTLCEKCGVLCDASSLRATRWGHLPLARPLRHPIGIDVEVVPVVPPGDRPLVASDDPARPARAPGPVNEAYRALVQRALRWRRLLELNAPDIILNNERRLTQEALERLYAVVRDPPPVATSGWSAPDPEEDDLVPLLTLPLRPPPPIDGDNDDDDDDERTALVFIDDARLAVQRGARLAIVALADGAVLARHDVGGATAVASDGAHLVLTAGTPYPDFGEEGPSALVGLHVLDVARGAWLDRYPESLPSVFFTQDQPEDAGLTDLRDGRSLTLDVPSDRPGVFAWARDQAFVWVGGDDADGLVIGTRDGLVYLETGALALDPERGPFLLADGRLVAEVPARDDDAADDDDDADADWRLSAAALALTSDRRWRVLSPTRAAGELDGQRFTLGFRARAAGFDPTGARLALLASDAILVVAWEGPRLLARLPLPDAAE